MCSTTKTARFEIEFGFNFFQIRFRLSLKHIIFFIDYYLVSTPTYIIHRLNLTLYYITEIIYS